ncbi:AKT5 [Symbiodinium sp. CCMP2456]|nr:AKT5 [Symbiodinium sp. CCMP2456]
MRRAESQLRGRLSFSLQPVPGPSFVEILNQIQALHEKLLQAYESDVDESKRLKPKSYPKLGNLKRTASAGVSVVSSDAELPVSHQASRASRASRGSRQLTVSLAKEAKDMTEAHMDEVLRHGDAAFQVADEWALDDDALADLEMTSAITSPKHPVLKTSGTGRKYRRVSGLTNTGCAIHPESPQRMFWDVLGMLVLLVEVLTVPLQVYDIAGDARNVADILHWGTTLYWVLDLPASFLTAVYINDVLHTSFADVARAYLKSWFVFDALMLAPEVVVFVNAFSPMEGVEMDDAAASGLLRALRARRLMKVVRFVRILRFRKAMLVLKKMSFYKQFRMFFSGRISSSLLPVLCLMCGLAISVHFLAALWFIAGTAERGWAFNEGLHEAPFALQYTRSVEWAVSRLPASALRANVELHTAFERWVAIMATFASLVISSLFISVITNLMADVARRTRKMAHILDSVRKYCGACGVSYGHTMKVRRLVEREHCRASIQEHMEFLLTLPETVVKELFHEARSITLACHPFFLELCAENNLMELQLCNRAAKELYLLEHDEIFRGNERGEGVYILASGGAQYIQGTEFYQPLHTAAAKGTASSVIRMFSILPGLDGGEKKEEGQGCA